MKHSYQVRNDKIILNPLNEKDSEKYRILRNREDNIKYFFSGKTITEDEQEKWYRLYLDDSTQIMFSILDSEEKFIGGIGIYDIDECKKTAEVGRIIVDRYLAGGKKLGGEAISLLSEIAKEKLKLSTVYANIYADNMASLKSFEYAGYEKVAQEDNIIRVEKKL